MSLAPLDYLFSLQQFGIKFGLENMHAILGAMDMPQHHFRALHVAGTNGKGSVSAMLESSLRAAGVRTGRYTSPHLVHLSERFAVDGRPVEESEVVAAVRRVQETVAPLLESGALPAHPTFFEATTAAAFEIFRRRGVEVAVCEVGMGGRLDATNVLSPMASAITSIGLDHQQYLGSTRAEIAAEKAGIIKSGVPVVVGPLPPEAMAVVRRVAVERDAPVVVAADDVRIESVRDSGEGQQFRAATRGCDYGVVTLPLPGDHQLANAAIAIRLLELAGAHGVTVGADDVRRGLSSVRWPGRLELRRLGDRSLLLDAAHNPEGAATLAGYLRRHGRRPLVFAAMKDKDVTGILAALGDAVTALIVTQASHPRAADVESLAAAAAAVLPATPLQRVPEPLAALDAAWASSPDIAVAGSIFLLGDVMKRWGVWW